MWALGFSTYTHPFLEGAPTYPEADMYVLGPCPVKWVSPRSTGEDMRPRGLSCVLSPCRKQLREFEPTDAPPWPHLSARCLESSTHAGSLYHSSLRIVPAFLHSE